MKYRNSIIVLGFLILFIQFKFLGFPAVFRDTLMVLSAVAIIVMSYLAGKR